MIISCQRRYIFAHIPKTGGTSMALALESRAAKDDILIGDTPKARQRKGRLEGLDVPGRLWKHSTLRDIEGLVKPADFFVFTLVRNPWDRMVSYYHWLQDQQFDHPAIRCAQSNHFKGFIQDAGTQASLRKSAYRTYVTDANGQDRCNLYARLEYAQDLAPLWKHLGFEVAIPTINMSERSRDWRVYYDTETVEIVSEIAGDDIARFGYTFEP